MTHEHEFTEPDSIEADEYLYISQPCQHVEILGSSYSPRHDEVFYDEGPACEAVRRTTYEPRSIVDIHEYHDEPYVIELDETNELPPWAETAWMAVEGRINHGPHDPYTFDPAEPEIAILAATEDTEYRMVYSREEQTVNYV